MPVIKKSHKDETRPTIVVQRYDEAKVARWTVPRDSPFYTAAVTFEHDLERSSIR